MLMQFLAKLHAHATVDAIFEEMQVCQYGFLSTCLDFSNGVLQDEDPKQIINCILSDEVQIGVSFVFFGLPL